MNEEATKMLLEWATQIKEGVATELPNLAREIVLFELCASIAWIVVCVLAIGGACLILRKLNKDAAEHGVSELREIGHIMSLLICLVGSIALLVNLNDAIKAATAPRLLVVETITKMIR